MESSNYNMRLKFIIILFSMLLLFSFVPAALDSLGSGQLREPFTLVQVCKNASYITLNTIQLPNRTVLNVNTNMTSLSSGTFQYIFNDTDTLGRYDVTGSSDSCEQDFAYFFEVTLSGDTPNVSAYIWLLLLIVFLFVLLIWFNIRFNKQKRDNLYKKIVVGYFNAKHGYKQGNLGEVIMFAIAYGLLKIMFVFYYLLIVLFLFILVEFIDTFGIKSLSVLSATILNISFVGIIPIFIIMFFNFYNLFRTLLDDITKTFQGVMKT